MANSGQMELPHWVNQEICRLQKYTGINDIHSFHRRTTALEDANRVP
jgi:hypothetical protein